MTTPTSAQPIVPLWDNDIPHSLGHGPDDIPTLTVFLPAKTSGRVPAIVIFPGGGYGMLAFEHEGINLARWFAERGVAAFVLRYRLPVNGYRHPVPLHDAQRSLRLVRARAAEWNIDPAKVGIIGFSAGGHLASTVVTHFDAGSDTAKDPVDRQSCRPDFGVLVYPVISLQEGITHSGSKLNLLGPDPDPTTVRSLSNETQVTPQTPPTLLVHSVDDGAVLIEHSLLMLAALQKAGIPSELHEYPTGGHGFGFGAKDDHSPAGWLDRVYDWAKAQGFLA